MEFTLTNTNELVNLNGVKPKFIIPKEDQLYKIDNISNDLIKELLNRNFNVAGINIKFNLSGFGKFKTIYISEIKGNSFLIKYNEYGLNKIIIPKLMFQKINIRSSYNDNILLILHKYIGDNWENDKKEFFETEEKFNSKKNNKPRTYLVYDTVYNPTEQNFLKHTNYADTEYNLKENDIFEYNYIDIEKEIIDFIDLLLIYVKNFKKEKFDINIFKEPPIIKLENEYIKNLLKKNTLYTFISEKEYERLHYIKSNLENNYESIIDYGLLPVIRLIPLDVKINDELTKKVYEGYIWCELYKDSEEDIKPNYTKNVFIKNKNYVKIELNNYNNVFIVDKYVEEQTRKEIFRKYKYKDQITIEDKMKIELSLAKTMIHINDYKNDYIKPIFVIKRELHIDEIDL